METVNIADLYYPVGAILPQGENDLSPIDLGLSGIWENMGVQDFPYHPGETKNRGYVKLMKTLAKLTGQKKGLLSRMKRKPKEILVKKSVVVNIWQRIA